MASLRECIGCRRLIADDGRPCPFCKQSYARTPASAETEAHQESQARDAEAAIVDSLPKHWAPKPAPETMPGCCPACSSENIQKAALAYMQGSWKGGAHGTLAGLLSIKIAGEGSSTFSAILAPPEEPVRGVNVERNKQGCNPPMAGCGAVFVVAVLMSTFVAPDAPEGLRTAVGLICCFVGVVAWVATHHAAQAKVDQAEKDIEEAHRDALQVYSTEVQRWQRQWVCLKCGTLWAT